MTPEENDHQSALCRMDERELRIQSIVPEPPDYSGCSALAVALMRRAFQFKSGRFSREFVARDFQRIIEEHLP